MRIERRVYHKLGLYTSELIEQALTTQEEVRPVRKFPKNLSQATAEGFLVPSRAIKENCSFCSEHEVQWDKC